MRRRFGSTSGQAGHLHCFEVAVVGVVLRLAGDLEHSKHQTPPLPSEAGTTSKDSRKLGHLHCSEVAIVRVVLRLAGGSGSRVLEFRISGLGFRVWGLGF